jgi:hypothetical protein
MISLSVLIPSIPSRWEKARKLFEKIQAQASGFVGVVEVLLLMDNKKRTVGEKRQALLGIAAGEYVAFVDDDDDVADYYVKALLSGMGAVGPDVITFNTNCILTFKDGKEQRGIVEQRLGNPEEGFKPWDTTLRRPTQIAAWKRSIAQQCKFPAIQYGEDRAWGDACIALAKTEHHIPLMLYQYNWSEEGTEAK